jgi:surface antigen
MKTIRIIAVVAALGMTAACANQGQSSSGGSGGISKQTGGAVLVGVGVGALLGSLLGSEVGKSLDRADQQAMNRTTTQTLETGPSNQPVTWRNPDSGNYGTITPQPAVQTASGEYCREFTQTINVGGKSEQGVGRACRQQDGSWRIVSQN